MREAARRIPEATSIAQRLNDTWRPRPVVAKRHSYLKGTLRYFEVRFADASTFSKHLLPSNDADGILIYCLPANKAEYADLADLATARTALAPRLNHRIAWDFAAGSHAILTSCAQRRFSTSVSHAPSFLMAGLSEVAASFAVSGTIATSFLPAERCPVGYQPTIEHCYRRSQCLCVSEC